MNTIDILSVLAGFITFCAIFLLPKKPRTKKSKAYNNERPWENIHLDPVKPRDATDHSQRDQMWDRAFKKFEAKVRKSNGAKITKAASGGQAESDSCADMQKLPADATKDALAKILARAKELMDQPEKPPGQIR